jgi:hypothetical protein
VVPNVSGGAGCEMPVPVGPSDNREAAGTPRRARVASPAMPEVQGEPGRVLSDTPSGLESSRVHEARLRPGRYELVARDDVWAGLQQRGATIANVPFSGHAGGGGSVDRIVLSRLQGNELVDVERWSGRDELCYAPEAPIWDRFGSFAGQPHIAGVVMWTAADRRVVIESRRGGEHFEELV